MQGLVEAFKKVLPGVEHRYCMRHMYANFQKLFKGKEYKDLMWGAASAYTKPGFYEKMEELKKLNKETYDWLIKESPEYWARHAFV